MALYKICYITTGRSQWTGLTMNAAPDLATQ